MPDLKPQPNHQAYLRALDRLGPSGRLRVACELSDATMDNLRRAIRDAFPDAYESTRHRLFMRQLDRCRSMNY